MTYFQSQQATTSTNSTTTSTSTLIQDTTAQMSASQLLLDGPLPSMLPMTSNHSRKRSSESVVVSDDESDNDDDQITTTETSETAKRQRRKAPKKSVHFSEFAKFRTIPARSQYHPTILNEMYLSRQDMQQAKYNIMESLRTLNAAGAQEIEGQESIRGLEKYVPSLAGKRSQRIRRSIHVVLEAQHQQQQTDDIARAYQKQVGPSVCTGYMRGALDQRSIYQRKGEEETATSFDELQDIVVQQYADSLLI